MRQQFCDATLNAIRKMVFNSMPNSMGLECMSGIDLEGLEVTAWQTMRELLEGTAPEQGTNAIADAVRKMLREIANGNITALPIVDKRPMKTRRDAAATGGEHEQHSQG
jgi:hypothetical protein